MDYLLGRYRGIANYLGIHLIFLPNF